MAFNRLIIFLLLLNLCYCVKYSFRGALPSSLESIYIEDFENNTQYPLVREEFMQKVTVAFINDNSLEVIDNIKSADLILKGTISSIRRVPVSITQEEIVQSFKMVVTVRAECMNTHTQKALWSGNVSNFSIISGEALSDEIDAANSVAINQIVEDIITKTIAAW